MKGASIVIETARGRLRGVRNGATCSFKGIAYAAQTSGSHRFQAPQPVPSWTGIKDALTHGDRCPQTVEGISRYPVFDWYGQDGAFSEDCCTLNVFAPTPDSGADRPVIVYIHGGGYASGSSNGPALDGSALASFGDVVVVTVNHRLNLFGYTNLAALDPLRFGESANAGQLDLIAALRWVQRHIRCFGGDPGNVTLLGQSGGGNKIMTLLAMPAAHGLFRRAINMSGASGLQLTHAEATAPYVGAMLDVLGVGKGELHKLQEMRVETLQQARNAAMVAVRADGAQPVVDGRSVRATPFSEEGVAMHASVPLLIGSTGTEATLFLSGDSRNTHISELELKGRIQKQFDVNATEAGELIALYRTEAPGRKAADVLFHLASDLLARGPLIQAAERKAKADAAPVYLYNFAWQIPGPHAAWRSPHAVDIPFAFGNLECARSMVGEGSGPSRVADQFMSAIVAFARNGDPNNPHIPAWKRYEATERSTMIFDEDCRVASDYQGAGRVAAQRLSTDVPPTTLLRGPLFRPSN